MGLTERAEEKPDGNIADETSPRWATARNTGIY
jgi:hypothetical protein